MEAEQIAVRLRYVRLKIDYWRAVSAGDEAAVERVASEAGSLADQLKPAKRRSFIKLKRYTGQVCPLWVGHEGRQRMKAALFKAEEALKSRSARCPK